MSSFLRGARLTVVLGVGSELRGDDAAGILVARRLARKNPRLVALEGHTAPESMAGKIAKLGPSHVLFVDAAEMGCEPGEWAMLRSDELDAAATTTHLIPLASLARHLADETGCAVGFLGVQPGKCGVAVGVSAPVRLVVGEISDKIVQSVSKNEPK